MSQIEVFDTFEAAEPMWRRLDESRPAATPYQRFEWLHHWFREVGARSGAQPLIVIGTDGHYLPSFIMPLTRERVFGCSVAGFGGGTHSNLNMPVWRPDVMAGLTAPAVTEIFRQVAGRCGIDLYALKGQPSRWRELPNPLSALPRQWSPDDVYSGTLDLSAEHPAPQLPGGMRKKARKLTKLDGFRYVMADTAVDVGRILDAFWPQKAARFASQGIPNVFQNPGVIEFIRSACFDGLDQKRPAIELHALEGDGEMLAIVGGVSDRDHFSVMFNSITASDHARWSPGIILMADIIENCASRGMTSYDLGAGNAHYKHYFCSGSQQRFDSFLPFTARGRVLAAAYRASRGVRRALKRNEAARNAIQAARRWISGSKAPSQTAEADQTKADQTNRP